MKNGKALFAGACMASAACGIILWIQTPSATTGHARSVGPLRGTDASELEAEAGIDVAQGLRLGRRVSPTTTEADSGVAPANARIVAASQVTGRVLDLAGAPVGGARVGARSVSRGQSPFPWMGFEAALVAATEADSDGFFALPVVAGASYLIGAEQSGFLAGAPREADAGEYVEVVLTRGVSFDVIVYELVDNGTAAQTRRAVEGAAIQLALPESANPVGLVSWSAVSDDDGSARFDSLPADRLDLTVMASAFEEWFLTVDLAEWGDAPFDLELSRGVGISGSVVRADNQTPIPHAVVRSDSLGVVRTDAQGEFAFPSATGVGIRTVVVVQLAGYRPAVEYVKADSASKSVRLTIELSESMRVLGSVITDRGDGLGGGVPALSWKHHRCSLQRG